MTNNNDEMQNENARTNNPSPEEIADKVSKIFLDYFEQCIESAQRKISYWRDELRNSDEENDEYLLECCKHIRYWHERMGEEKLNRNFAMAAYDESIGDVLKEFM